MGRVLCHGNGSRASVRIVEEASELTRILALLESKIYDTTHLCEVAPEGCLSLPDCVVCAARLMLGACCEAFASKQCSCLFLAGEQPRSPAAARRACQLYHDASLAACWTSAHAQYLHDMTKRGWAVAWPSIHSVACASSEADLSDIYARRVCTQGVLSKDALHMLALLTRCTNPGARGCASRSLSARPKHARDTVAVCSGGTVS